MRKPPLFAPLLALPLALAGCGSNDNDPGPGGVTVAEAKALDEAAAMIDARKPPSGALDEDPASAAPSSAAGD